MERCGVRRLCALVGGLPPDSATARQGKAWTFRDEMDVTFAERQDMWSNLALQVQGAKQSQIPAPIVFTHPDRVDEKPAKKKATLNEALAFFGQLKGR